HSLAKTGTLEMPITAVAARRVDFTTRARARMMSSVDWIGFRHGRCADDHRETTASLELSRGVRNIFSLSPLGRGGGRNVALAQIRMVLIVRRSISARTWA